MSIGLERLASHKFNFLSKDFGYSSSFNDGKLLTGLIRYLYIRNNKGDFLNCRPLSFNYKESGYSYFSAYSSFTNYFSNENKDNYFELHCVYDTPSNALNNFSIVNNKDIIELNQPSCPISQYLSSLPKQQARVFVNKTQQTALVFTTASRPSNVWFAKLYSSFSKIFPKIVGDIDDNLIKLLSTISKLKFDEANEIVENEIKNIDFEKEINRAKLYNFLNDYYKDKKNHILGEIRYIYNDIKDHEYKINEALNKIREKNIYIEGIETLCSKTDNNDVFTFFEQHKCLEITGIQKPKIYFVIRETVEYYDVDEFNRCKNNWDYPSAFVKDIMRGLFEFEKGNLYVLSKFCIEEMSSIEALYDRNDIEYFSDVEKPYMPHPHLGEYACLGGNKQNINQYLQNGDWDLAIEQCIAATKNVAFGDASVMSYLRNWIDRNRDIKCVKVGDNLLTFNEFHKLIEGDLHNGEEN